MILVGFATAFRATFCQRVEIFNIKISFVEPRFSKSVIPDYPSSSAVLDLRAKVAPATAEDEVLY